MKRQAFLAAMFALGLSLGGVSVITWAEISALKTQAGKLALAR